MLRPFAIAAALTLTTAAQAQAPNAYYVAIPAAQPAKASFIVRSTPWVLRDGALIANQNTERPQIVCELVAKQVGALTSFSAGGAAFDAAALEKCNARAK